MHVHGRAHSVCLGGGGGGGAIPTGAILACTPGCATSTIISAIVMPIPIVNEAVNVLGAGTGAGTELALARRVGGRLGGSEAGGDGNGGAKLHVAGSQQSSEIHKSTAVPTFKPEAAYQAMARRGEARCPRVPPDQLCA